MVLMTIFDTRPISCLENFFTDVTMVSDDDFCEAQARVRQGRARDGQWWPVRRKALKLKPLPRAYIKVGCHNLHQSRGWISPTHLVIGLKDICGKMWSKHWKSPCIKFYGLQYRVLLWGQDLRVDCSWGLAMCVPSPAVHHITIT